MGVYQRGGQWWIEYRYKKKRHREAVGPDKDLAIDVLGQKRVEIRENRFFPNKQKELDPMEFHSFAVQYIAWAKTNKKPSSVKNDISRMRFLEKEFKRKDLGSISSKDIEEYKTKRRMEVAIRKNNKVGPAKINSELALFKHMFNKAVEWGVIKKENPMKSVKMLKGVKNRLRYLMPDEVQRLIENCPEHFRPIVMFALHTGCRKEEILSLKWSQVNLEQKMISLTDTKNHERREVPINETAKEVLLSLKKEGPYVFPSRRGERWINITMSWQRVLKDTQIEDFHFHDLRHTFASNLVMNGVDLMVIKELLGHRTIEMTMRYAHLSPHYKTRAVNILDEVFRGPSKEEKNIYLSRGRERSQNPPHYEIAQASEVC